MPLQSKESKQVLKDYIENLKTGDKNNELIVDMSGKNLMNLAKKTEAGLAGLLKGFFKFKMNDETRYVINILISMIPIAIVGFCFKDKIEEIFGSGCQGVWC